MFSGSTSKGQIKEIGLIITVVISIIILIGFAYPTIISLISNPATAGSTTEQFAGVNGTVAGLSQYVISVTTFQKSTGDSGLNDTVLAGANATRNVALLTPVRAAPWNMTIVVQKNSTENISATVGSCHFLDLNDSSNDFVNISSACLSAPLTVSFSNNGTHSNITEIRVADLYWATSTAYGLSGGHITPTQNGTFNINYTYGYPSDAMTMMIVYIIAFFLILAALMMAAYMIMK